MLRNKGNKIERLQSGKIPFYDIALGLKMNVYIVDITNLSKPLLQSEGAANWSKHVTPGTLSVFQDEKSWNGISNIEIKGKSTGKEFRDVNGLSWSTMRDAMQMESEGKHKKKNLYTGRCVCVTEKVILG